MHIRTFCVLLTMLLLATTGIAAAHPPGQIQLDSEQTGELVFTVTHDVADPATHFVRQAEVRKNGEIVISERYTSQPSADTFTYLYPVPLSPGDEVAFIPGSGPYPGGVWGTSFRDSTAQGSWSGRQPIPGAFGDRGSSWRGGSSCAQDRLVGQTRHA